MNAVASPCINVCEMDAGSGLCRGCLRSLDEIAGWQAADDDEKRAILARIAQRRAGHAAGDERPQRQESAGTATDREC